MLSLIFAVQLHSLSVKAPTLPFKKIQISSPIKVGAFQTFDGSNVVYVPAKGYTGPGIVATGSPFRIENVTLKGFSTGIYVNCLGQSDGTCESWIQNFNIYNYSNCGIEWISPSDGYIENGVCANIQHGDDWHKYKLPDPFFSAYGGTTPATAYAGIKLGPGNAGGITVSNTHEWGNESFDIADFAANCFLYDNRLEGGRLAMLGLFSFDSHVRGGSIWSFLDSPDGGKTFPNGVAPQMAICLGTTYQGVGYPAGNNEVNDLWVSQEGFIPYILGYNRVYGGNMINIKCPPDYVPDQRVYKNADIGKNKLNITIQGLPDSGAVWHPSTKGRS